MKFFLSRVLLIISIPAFFFILICGRVSWMDYFARKKHAEKQYGIYILDTKKTDLGAYGNELEKYKNLQIVFKKDMTFTMNMSVPFIFDSCGTWEAASYGVEDWGRLNFKRRNYIIYAQLSECCLEDSTSNLSGVTPVENQEQVSKIYFKKLHPKPDDFKW